MGARKLAAYVHVNGEVYGPHSDVPAEVAKQITNPKAWEGGDAPEVDGSDGVVEEKPYAKRKKGELEELVAERNKDREDEAQIVVEGKGTVADLAAALDADDAALAAAEQSE